MNKYIMCCVLVCFMNGCDIFPGDVVSNKRNIKYVYRRGNVKSVGPKQQMKRKFHPKG